MPRTPRINTSVAPVQGSMGRLRINAPVEAFGGGAAAQGLAQVGQGLGAVGQGMQAVEARNERERQQEERKRKAEEARKTKTEISRARAETMFILNEAKLAADKAVDGPQVDEIWNKAFKKVADEKGNWLTTEASHQMFNEFTDLEYINRTFQARQQKIRIDEAKQTANYEQAKEKLGSSAVDTVSFQRNREGIRQNAEAYWRGRVVDEEVDAKIKQDMQDYDKNYLRAGLDNITASGDVFESEAELVMFEADVNTSSLDQDVKNEFIARGHKEIVGLKAAIERQREAAMSSYFDNATEDLFAPGQDVAQMQQKFAKYSMDSKALFGDDAGKKLRILKRAMDTAVSRSDKGAALRTKSAFYESAGDFTAANLQLDAEADAGNISGEEYGRQKQWIKKQQWDSVSRELAPTIKEIRDMVKEKKLRGEIVEQNLPEDLGGAINMAWDRMMKRGPVISLWRDFQRSRGDVVTEEEAVELIETIEQAVRAEGATTPQARQQIVDSILAPSRLKDAEAKYEGERWQERAQQARLKAGAKTDVELQKLRMEAFNANKGLTDLSDKDIEFMAEQEQLEK